MEDNDWPRQMLFSCTTQDTREVFAGLVVSVITCLIQAGERGLYDEVEEMEMDESDELDGDGEVVVIPDEKKRRVCIPSFAHLFIFCYSFSNI